MFFNLYGAAQVVANRRARSTQPFAVMKDDEVAKLNFDRWPLPDPYLLELGRVAALWASLESFLNICIGKLAGFNDQNDPTAFILVTHSSFPQRLDILSALCEHLVNSFPTLKGYKAVVERLRSAQKLRNDFMHYGMSENPDSGNVEMAKGTARATLKLRVEKVTLADLRRASMAIHEAELQLYKLVLGKTIPPIWTRR